jgi:hypothetical protein
VLKFGIKTLVNKNNSRSLILTNLELQFEPYMLNRFGSDVQKTQKKKKTI